MLILQNFSHKVDKYRMKSLRYACSNYGKSEVDAISISLCFPAPQLSTPVTAQQIKLVIADGFDHFASVHSLSISGQ